MKLRLKTLEEKSAKENFILTEAQVQALERLLMVRLKLFSHVI